MKTYVCDKTDSKDFSRPRPSDADKDILKAAAAMVWPKIKQWVESDGDTDPIEPEAEQQFVDWFMDEVYYGKDGFELTKSMEGSPLYYTGDSQLVEIMDDASHAVYKARDAAEKEWVKEQGLKPTLKEGDKAAFYKKKYRADKGVRMEGEVSGIYAEAGKYVIFSEAAGHTVSHASGKPFRGGAIIDFEDAEALEAVNA